MKILVVGGLSLGLLFGCSTMKIEDFAKNEPELVLEEYFAGKVKAYGIFEDRFGNLRRQFTVDINGTWDGQKLVLDERFYYSDGEQDQREWVIQKISDGEYRGRAGDVIGEDKGIARGNALNWRYDMDLKVGSGTMRVHFNDWMFLQSTGVLLNRAAVSKFGIKIGTVTLAFVKDEKHPRSLGG